MMATKKTPLPNSSIDPVTAYARAVLAGDEVAGPHVRAACARHMRDLETGYTRGLRFDLEAVDRILRFFPTVLRLSDGQFEGRPFELHPSQQFKLGSIFGWKRADGTRRFRRAYIEEGKGNGKSPLAGGIGLYGLASDKSPWGECEPGAQIYAAGSTKDQAKILFNDAVKMAEQSASLARKITFSGNKPHVWNMAILQAPQKGAFFRPVSRDTKKSGSGPRPHFALIDELHEHPDRGTIEMLERGFKFRRQPLLLMITNSGTDRKSVCREEHEHAVKVAHGDIEDDTTFSYVCALDEGDDPLKDSRCWKKVNPLLGVILTEDYLAGVVAQARAIPGKRNNILRLHFCVWTDAESAWIARETWEGCEDPTLKLADFRGRRCWAGLDLSSTKDLTGKGLVFEDGETEDGKPKYAAFAHGYTPKDTLIERADADKAPYDVWAREGFLTATPGAVVRYDYVASDLIDDQQLFDLQAVAYDRFLIKTFEAALGELGGELPLIEHGQGIGQRKGCPPDCDKPHQHTPAPLWMPGSIETLETLILEKRIRFYISPALRSCVSAARFWTSPAGLRRFDKQAPGGRIDLLVALVMAVGAATAKTVVRKREYQMFFVGTAA
jgi:phage terminase large subunit-like protein